MAKKLYEESSIQAIADAIREKNGQTTTYKPSEMAAAITAITTGGGSEVEPIVLTGDQNYGCAGSLSTAYIEKFGNTITTTNLGNTKYMFNGNMLESIPITLNYNSGNTYSREYMFNECKNLKTLPTMTGVKVNSLTHIFDECQSLREIPNNYFDDWNCDAIASSTSAYQGNWSGMFKDCYSLRSCPLEIFKKANPRTTSAYSYLYQIFYDCYVLDEIVNMPIAHKTVPITSAMFSNTVLDCFRLKNFIFETNEDGTPIVVQWKKQTIDLTTVGYRDYGSGDSSETWDPTSDYFKTWTENAPEVKYNSGITADKVIYNTTTYATLKDDPDAWCLNGSKNSGSYSRYNRTSAVATINSLPDTSAYLATAGGTNTIKFKGAAGSATDGGAINTLTEEEIAVAAAKGWTVTLV